MDFTHLHVHDEFSALDGFGKASDYAKKAQELGFGALAITNHGNVDGSIKFQNACAEHGVSPLIGCELYLVKKDMASKEAGQRVHHITVLVRRAAGWHNLLRILTLSNIEGFYRRPRIDAKSFLERCKGLVVLSGCASSCLRTPWGEEFLLDLREELSGDVYLEVMPHLLDDQKAVNFVALKLSRKHGFPLVATNDCHYPNAPDATAQEVLLAMQRKAKWDDPERWRFDIRGLHLRTYEEMVRAFEKQGALGKVIVAKALRQTEEVAAKCKDFSIRQQPVELPCPPGLEGKDERKFLRGLIEEGLQERIVLARKQAKPLSDYKARIEEEFNLICELGFERYFLVVWELIRWCRDNDIMTGPGRGSVGGCLVAYLLYITDVDPLRYGLVFSRFISPARIDLPDIDMDFEDTKRGLIREHLEEAYGKNNVAGLTTFASMKGRGSLRDVSRVFDIPHADVDAAAKSIVTRSGGDFRSDFTIEDAFDTFEDGIRFKEKYPKITRLAMKLEGQVRGYGQHAAAMCVSKEDLRKGRRCNLATRKGVVVANWDKNDAEYVGLMKLDVLGLSTLSVLNETRKMVKRNYGIDISFDDLPLDDEAVYSEVSKGYTVGAFQIGSPGLSQYCKVLGVDNFDMLVHATSLWRPGTLRSGMTMEFAQRKNGEVKWSHVHPSMEPLTKDTYGIILYQEQVMQMMYDLAGLPWRTCDTVRKVISKSQGDELFKTFRQQFIDGCKERKTLPPDVAGDVWGELSHFGSYQFNKAHAVEYSLITYWCLWMKVHYPTEFMACSLSYGAENKKEELIPEARRMGLEIETPKVGASDALLWETRPDDKRLFMPFCEIKGVGDKTAENIARMGEPSEGNDGFFGPSVSARGGKGRKVNKTVMEKLRAIKAFDLEASIGDDDGVEDFFAFDISKDPLRRIRGIISLLQEEGVLSKMSDDSLAKDKDVFHIGMIPDLRFGYRQTVLKALKEEKGGPGDIAGTGENMGGVYGYAKDGISPTTTTLIFEGGLYQRKKDAVEHCQGLWLLAKGHYGRKGNFICQDMAVESDLASCNIGSLGLNLIKRKSIPKEALKSIQRCADCPSHPECKGVVLPSVGEYNVMVLGEGPGPKENVQREGFVGPAGEVLWEEFNRHGLSRSRFHISNVVKCFSGRAKNPTQKQVDLCSEGNLRGEIEALRPILILALGNTCLRALKGQESGISSLSGTTEWIDKLGCWVSWCLHPASVLHSRRNKETFSLGIEHFRDRLYDIGWPQPAEEVRK